MHCHVQCRLTQKSFATKIYKILFYYKIITTYNFNINKQMEL